ncbi:MAG: DNA polymerase III subunit delta' [Deltaproteobacteria bacterium]|jgi:DNA polymerase-3 subunit delta'|nr:DNA polymerase III subunit delta' [Deltaproteobacteria bacterium]
MNPGKRRREDLLPDPEELEALLEPARAFAFAPRFERLRRSMELFSSDPPQCLLLEGGNAAERARAALYWGCLLNCPEAASLETGEGGKRPCLACPLCVRFFSRLHQDLYFFDGAAKKEDGSPKTISIDEVRGLRGLWGESPRSAGRRVVIFSEGQALLPPAANALLKTLEEPKPGNVFVLTVPQRERLLPTLVSRSLTLTLPWPDPARAEDPDPEALAALDEWINALLDFCLNGGKGWMARTSGRGSLSADLAMRLVLLCQQALVLSFEEDAARLPRAGGLVRLLEAFRPLEPRKRRILYDLLAEGQDSLIFRVNPALVADWLATRMFFVLGNAA